MQLVSRDRRGRRVASQWMVERADKGPPAAAQGCSWLGVPRKAPGHREWIARVVGAQHGGEGIIEQRAGTAERWRGDHRAARRCRKRVHTSEHRRQRCRRAA